MRRYLYLYLTLVALDPAASAQTASQDQSALPASRQHQAPVRPRQDGVDRSEHCADQDDDHAGEGEGPEDRAENVKQGDGGGRPQNQGRGVVGRATFHERVSSPRRRGQARDLGNQAFT